MRTLLLDTGPVVALLDATDPEHVRSREVLADFRGELWTTCAVMTEIMHLLRRNTPGPRTVVEFVAASRLRIEACGDLNTLIRSGKIHSDLLAGKQRRSRNR